MPLPSSCPDCGLPLVNGRCTRCAERTLSRFVRREVLVLAVLIALAIGAFAVTRNIAALSARLRRDDAAAWHHLGNFELAAGRPGRAADALRRASALARGNVAYRLAFANALVAADREDAARQVLQGLRELTPESPPVNLRLARLEAARKDLTAATRYYQSALYGLWDADDVDARRQLRVEFIGYLLANEQDGRALAELLVLEGSLPDDAASHNEVARLFAEAGDPARAVQHFQRTLRLEPRNVEALTGAAEAAFALGDYPRARRFLLAAPAAAGRVAELRAIVDLVLDRDPLRPRLSAAERRRRLSDALAHVTRRMDACPAAQDPERDALYREAQALASALARRTAAPLETIEGGVDLVYRIEQHLSQSCGLLEPLDRALVLIGRRHRADQ